jgi:hypothetical protein
VLSVGTFGGSPLLQQGQLDFQSSERSANSQPALAAGSPVARAKAHHRRQIPSWSAEALLPSHQCEGSHRKRAISVRSTYRSRCLSRESLPFSLCHIPLVPILGTSYN